MKIFISTDNPLLSDRKGAASVNPLVRMLQREKYEILIASPEDYWGAPMPMSGGKKLSFPFGLQQSLKSFQPDAVHIITEGTLGLAARQACLDLQIPFTTEYKRRKSATGVLKGALATISTSYSKWFHGPSSRVLCQSAGTATSAQELGIAQKERISIVERGVDAAVFRPPFWKKSSPHVHGKKLLCVSSFDKDSGAHLFCELSEHGYECTILGHGPLFPGLKKKFPKVRYKGSYDHVQCASEMRDHSILVSPIAAEEEDNLMPEANSCGLPIVALPTESARRWIDGGRNGICAEGFEFEHLLKAVGEAFAQCSPKEACGAVRSYSWENSSRRFVAQLERIPSSFYS